MSTEQYVSKIEAIIAAHQQVQMANPPSSDRWQEASQEIHRLAELIIEARKS